jgi:D-beta-D-heptose 7-phosphate kinase/D-beta-D-heptose 1-phosphate adenosyltransferase
MKNTIVAVSGGFDPIHSGHIEMLYQACAHGTHLIVGLNSDEWLSKKKGRPFMSFKERSAILSAIKGVDRVVRFDDSDGTACNFLKKLKDEYPECDIIFANGGDRTAENVPEMSVPGIEFKFYVGGEKSNSSSEILKRWMSVEVQRSWGSYTVLNEVPGAKIKTLRVMPGRTLSMQRHQHRSEYWMVTEGTCMINMSLPGDMQNPPKILGKYDEWRIPKGAWHQLANPFSQPCTIVEIQYGEQCVEEDIERLESTS